MVMVKRKRNKGKRLWLNKFQTHFNVDKNENSVEIYVVVQYSIQKNQNETKRLNKVIPLEIT